MVSGSDLASAIFIVIFFDMTALHSWGCSERDRTLCRQRGSSPQLKHANWHYTLYHQRADLHQVNGLFTRPSLSMARAVIHESDASRLGHGVIATQACKLTFYEYLNNTK